MKKKILDCAIADFLVYGFKNVTMDDLAQKLGISKKTIYDNFSTKQELVAEAANTIFENVSSTIQKIHREEIDPVMSLFDIKKEVTKYYNDVQNSPQYQLQKYYPEIWASIKSKELKKFGKLMTKSLEKGVIMGLFRADIDCEFISLLYFNGIRGIRDPKLFPPQHYKFEDLLMQYFSYHLSAIATPKGLELFKSYNAASQPWKHSLYFLHFGFPF